MWMGTSVLIQDFVIDRLVVQRMIDKTKDTLMNVGCMHGDIF